MAQGRLRIPRPPAVRERLKLDFDVTLCPRCAETALTLYEASPGLEVEICPGCRGLFLDRGEIHHLAGPGSLDRVTRLVSATRNDDLGLSCPKCAGGAMRPLRLDDERILEGWECLGCGGLWLAEGVLPELARRLRGSPSARRTSLAPSARRSGREALAYGRSRHDRGLANLVAVPAALLVAWLVTSTAVGALFSLFVAMAFHELGHALASWLSSRMAVPLPFVTFWSNDQSMVMGVVMVAGLAWLAVRTWRERNRFMFAAALAVALVWAVATFVVPARQTLMWQLLAGGLGELALSAFLLVGFHFPLPDRLRWDFWRWIALVPAALCFTRALGVWAEAAGDTRRMPWGSAVGSERDGDLNRLVANFDWSPAELAELHLGFGWLCLVAVGLLWGYAVIRQLVLAPPAAGTAP